MSDLLARYTSLVHAYPLLSAALQFAVLGTLGELLACRLRGRGWLPFKAFQLLAKIVVWAGLGIAVKVAFAGFVGFLDTILARGLWPAAIPRVPGVWWRAFSLAFITNALFGPMLILAHRVADNSIERNAMNWTSLVGAWWTLVYFWMPAHTLTFYLPPTYRVGLAAIWSLALGIILGLFARSKAPAAEY